MSRAVCPECDLHIEPTFSGSRFELFCPTCGWNRGGARREIKSEVLAAAGCFIGSIAVFSAWAFWAPGLWQFFVLACVLFGSAIAIPCRAWKASRRVDAGPAAQNLPVKAAFAALIPSSQEAQSIFAAVLQLFRPRPIACRLFLIGVTVFVIALPLEFIWLSYEANHGGDISASGTGLLMLIGLAGAIIWRLMKGSSFPAWIRHWRLIRSGEATVGRVIWSSSTTNQGGSSIFYAFVDQTSRHFIGHGEDLGGNLSEGAPLVVFYDGLDPDHNTALDCFGFSLRLPGQSTKVERHGSKTRRLLT